MPASLQHLSPVLGDALVRDPDIAATYAVDSSYGASAPENFTVVRARDVADVVALEAVVLAAVEAASVEVVCVEPIVKLVWQP